MSRAHTTARLRLLGTFTVEVNAGRPIAVALRLKKARALLAYLAMTPDWRASREELAALLWGDTPDAEARHSLRQTLLSLHRDLHLAPELFGLGRDTVELRPQAISVDARELATLADSGEPGDLDRAAELWRGPFLADLTLAVEDFDSWREQERERLAGVAARVFEQRCAAADAAGDGARALAAAERLVALDPTREDRQRIALRIVARYRGRNAALDRAKQLTSLLRTELDVAPDVATRALIEDIRTGELDPASAVFTSPRNGEADARSASVARPEARPKAIGSLTPSLLSPAGQGGQAPSSSSGGASAKADTARPSPGASPAAIGSAPPVARRSGLSAWGHRRIAVTVLSVLAVGALTALGFVTGMPVPSRTAQNDVGPQPVLASAIVVPFSVDGDSHDPAFARRLSHDLTTLLARFSELRIIAERTADRLRDRDVDLAALGPEFDVQYAIVGRVDQSERELRASVQLVDTATRTTLWSDTLRREVGEPAPIVEEMARALARMVDLNIVYAEERQLRRDPDRPPSVRELMLRGRVAETHSYLRENLGSARRLYEEALKRAPNNAAAMLGVARTDITASLNYVDPDVPPDLERAQGLLDEVLRRYPNWAAAHFTLGLLQKHRRQFTASLHSFRRCLELNPTSLLAQGQIGAVLTRMGQAEQAMDAIREAMRVSTLDDPNRGVLYLFAAEAELELGHQQAALDWALRANSFMPGSAVTQVWIASIYADMGDQPNVAKYVAALKTISPTEAQRLAEREAAAPAPGRRRTRLLEALHVAFSGPPG